MANPFQQPEARLQDEAPRVSALAVCSLVFGMICCVPASGLIATILGGAAMVRISRSEGRLSGRTLAFIGLALGIFVSMIQLAIVVGGFQAAAGFRKGLVEPAYADLRAIENGDWSGARKLLHPSATVTDDELKGFKESVSDKFGTVVGWPKDFTLPKMINQQPTVAQGSGNRASLPLPVEFSTGNAWVIVVADPNQMFDVFFSGKSIEGSVFNIGVIGEGKEVWLRPVSAPTAPLPPKPPTPNPSPAERPAEKPAGG